MGDSGEGLVDAEARIQERMDELARERGNKQRRNGRDPELQRALESLKLTRTQLDVQLRKTTFDARKSQLIKAIDDIDRKMADVTARMAVR